MSLFNRQHLHLCFQGSFCDMPDASMQILSGLIGCDFRYANLLLYLRYTIFLCCALVCDRMPVPKGVVLSNNPNISGTLILSGE